MNAAAVETLLALRGGIPDGLHNSDIEFGEYTIIATSRGDARRVYLFHNPTSTYLLSEPVSREDLDFTWYEATAYPTEATAIAAIAEAIESHAATFHPVSTRAPEVT